MRIHSSFIRPRRREKPRNPAGDYIFTYKRQEYRLAGHWVNDPTSPDGQRWIAHSPAKKVINLIVRELAGNRCELEESKNCWGWVPEGSGSHHVITKKMGGAFTDDRIWRNGERIRILACKSCHQAHHGEPQFGLRKTG